MINWFKPRTAARTIGDIKRDIRNRNSPELYIELINAVKSARPISDIDRDIRDAKLSRDNERVSMLYEERLHACTDTRFYSMLYQLS